MSNIVPGSILDTTVTTVTNQFSRLEDMKTRYEAALSAALAELAKIEVGDVRPPSPWAMPEVKPPLVQLDSLPQHTPPAINIPGPPADLNLGSLLSNLDVGDMGALPDVPDAPLVTLPTAPGLAAFTPPTRPSVDTSVELPAAPTIAMPEMEQLTQITLPDFVFPELPTFDATPPNAGGLTVPNVFINWKEPEYESELLDELVEKVREMMAGGTGLPAPIEDALFARARERLSDESRRAEQQAVDTWAARGFTLPPGMLQAQLDEVRQGERLKVAELNRDVFIEAAKWEIESIRFAVTQGIALEQAAMNLYENTVKRLFEVARFGAESQIAVFNAQVSLFNAQSGAFRVLADVYRTKLDGALAKLTAYKTAIEGQAVKGQINEQKVKVFQARLEAVRSSTEVFKTLMQGAQVRADVIKSQFDAYRTDMQAFAESLNAEKLKFDAYEAQIRGETAKVGLFDSQVRAYAATVQAAGTKADTRVKGAQLKLEAARAKVAQYTATLDGYKAQLDFGMRQAQYATTVFTANVDAWKAKAQAETTQAEAATRFADMHTRTSIAYAGLQMQEYQAKMQHAVQQAQLALEAAKAMGSFSAQLAAGAMSAAKVGADLGARVSFSHAENFETIKRYD